jgi:hypothetical protein
MWRGIIEGAYGPTWDHAARSRMLNWMPPHGFNTYVHAPKDDPFQRALWREPWPAADLRDYLAEMDQARRKRIAWIPNISPGVPLIPTPLPAGTAPSDPICFSCPGDLQLVVDKLAPFIEAGARTVVVSFDDVRQAFTHDEDVQAFGSGTGAFGAANANFLNNLYDALNRRWADVQLLTVPSDYAGTRDTEYLQGLRAALRPAVQVMWTGPRSRSTQWSPADARAYAALVGRTPIVWDNWANNDFFGGGDPVGAARVFLGPYTRSPAVVRTVAGFFFNPANESDLNKLPLATAGDWLRNPARYRPRDSWLRAVASLAKPGSGINQTLRAWAETSYSTKLSANEGPTFTRLAREFLGAFDEGAWWGGALARLRSELWLASDARIRLTALPDRPFYMQARPFLDAAWRAAQAGIVAATLLEIERPTLRAVRTPRGGFRVFVAPAVPARADTLRILLAQQKGVMQASERLVYGWRPLGAAGIPPYGRPNVMDDFVAQVEQRDATWRLATPEAVASVAISVNGQPGPPPVDGSLGLSGAHCGEVVIARDGAGGQNAVRLPLCR